VQPLQDLSQALSFGADRGHVFLQLRIALAQVRVLASQLLVRRGRGHVAGPSLTGPSRNAAERVLIDDL
jgi:hypothetical protein